MFIYSHYQLLRSFTLIFNLQITSLGREFLESPAFLIVPSGKALSPPLIFFIWHTGEMANAGKVEVVRRNDVSVEEVSEGG